MKVEWEALTQARDQCNLINNFIRGLMLLKLSMIAQTESTNLNISKELCSTLISKINILLLNYFELVKEYAE